MTELNTSLFDDFRARDDYEGFGYIGERNRWLPRSPDLVRWADDAILTVARNRGWDADRLFQWANSKHGRWFADEAFGGGTLERAIREHLPA